MIFVVFMLASYDVSYSNCVDVMYSQHLCADIVYVQFDVLCISTHYVLNYVCSILSINKSASNNKICLGRPPFLQSKTGLSR